MKLDLYVDTSRKGISMAVATDGQGDSARYEEIVNPDARGEILEERTEAFVDDAWHVIARERYTHNAEGKRIARKPRRSGYYHGVGLLPQGF